MPGTEAAARGYRRQVIRVQILFLYLVQVAAGYLLMLISMTYHAVLFAGVVGGLSRARCSTVRPVAAGGAPREPDVAAPSLAVHGGAKDGDGDASISSIDSRRRRGDGERHVDGDGGCTGVDDPRAANARANKGGSTRCLTLGTM